jgi:F-type H+-transporting ATPase subunit b
MDERKKMVESNINEASEMKKNAQMAEKDYLQKQQDLENLKNQIIEKTKNETKKQQEDLVNNSKKDVEQQKIKWNEDILRQKENFLSDLRSEIIKKFIDLSSKILVDLSSQSLQSVIIEHFLENLKKEKIDIQEKNVVLESSWELNDDDKQKISDRLKKIFNKDLLIKYVVNQDLVLGLNFQINGKSIKWNLQNYLNNFEDDLSQFFTKI